MQELHQWKVLYYVQVVFHPKLKIFMCLSANDVFPASPRKTYSTRILLSIPWLFGCSSLQMNLGEKMDITYKGKWVNLKRNNFWLFWSHRLATWPGWQILRTFKTQLYWPFEMVQSCHPLPKSRVLDQVTWLICALVSADPEMLIQNSNVWPGLEGNKITIL